MGGFEPPLLLFEPLGPDISDGKLKLRERAQSLWESAEKRAKAREAFY